MRSFAVLTVCIAALVAAAVAQTTPCNGLTQTQCAQNSSCAWCVSAAVPSACYSIPQTKKLPPGVFKCPNPQSDDDDVKAVPAVANQKKADDDGHDDDPNQKGPGKHNVVPSPMQKTADDDGHDDDPNQKGPGKHNVVPSPMQKTADDDGHDDDPNQKGPGKHNVVPSPMQKTADDDGHDDDPNQKGPGKHNVVPSPMQKTADDDGHDDDPNQKGPGKHNVVATRRNLRGTHKRQLQKTADDDPTDDAPQHIDGGGAGVAIPIANEKHADDDSYDDPPQHINGGSGVVAVANGWANCASSAALLHNMDVQVPSSLKHGATWDMIVSGSLSQAVTSGNVMMSVSFSGVVVHSGTSSLCSLTACPISAGDFKLPWTGVIPMQIPSGDYKVKFAAADQNDAQIFCVDAPVTIQS